MNVSIGCLIANVTWHLATETSPVVFPSEMDRRISPESEATISQPSAQMTGGYITYQIIKCQYHIALLGTNKYHQISNIIHYRKSAQIPARDPGTGRNLHTDSQDLWTKDL
jgi:hypothetical protein